MSQKELEKILQKSEDPIAEIGGTGFEVNDLGSCQYAGALDMIRIMEKLTEAFGYKEALKKLEIAVTFERIRPIEEVSELFCEDEGENEPPGFDSIDDIFDWTRDEAWDLWGAAPYIAGFVFKELDYKRVKPAPGVGPIYNIFAQNENYEVGLCCFLLMHHCEVDFDSFVDFDT